MGWRATLERWRQAVEANLLARWFPAAAPETDLLARWCLIPLSMLVAWQARRQRLRIIHWSTQHRPAVIVVGNLIVGGAGKTPLTLELARQLTARGWKVGLLARGHRAADGSASLVGPDDDPVLQGDEPVLLARESGLPVARGVRRGAALAILTERHPSLEIVISDDGLQHAGLPRTLELAVFDGRGGGNGRLLPAGPLREPLAHVEDMDAMLVRSERTGHPPILPGRQPRASRASISAAQRLLDGLAIRRYGFEVDPIGFVPLLEGQAKRSIAEFLELARGRRVHALAGIAQPERFFDSLRHCGLSLTGSHPMSDHAPAHPDQLPAQAELIVMTGKDAVKFGGLADTRCWYLAIQARCEPAFIDWLEETLRGSSTD